VGEVWEPSDKALEKIGIFTLFFFLSFFLSFFLYFFLSHALPTSFLKPLYRSDIFIFRLLLSKATALQVRRSWVRFPMVSVEFFIDIILPAALWPGG